MNTHEQMQDAIDSVSTNGTPDRDKAQATLTEQFIAALLLRGGDTPDEVLNRFAEQYDSVLRWLGETRQDEILRAAMTETGVDLSYWLVKEGE